VHEKPYCCRSTISIIGESIPYFLSNKRNSKERRSALSILVLTTWQIKGLSYFLAQRLRPICQNKQKFKLALMKKYEKIKN
jgi:hypothetical protein